MKVFPRCIRSSLPSSSTSTRRPAASVRTRRRAHTCRSGRSPRCRSRSSGSSDRCSSGHRTSGSGARSRWRNKPSLPYPGRCRCRWNCPGYRPSVRVILEHGPAGGVGSRLGIVPPVKNTDDRRFLPPGSFLISKEEGSFLKGDALLDQIPVNHPDMAGQVVRSASLHPLPVSVGIQQVVHPVRLAHPVVLHHLQQIRRAAASGNRRQARKAKAALKASAAGAMGSARSARGRPSPDTGPQTGP